MHNIDGYKSEKGLLIFTTGKQIYQTFLIYDKKNTAHQILTICVRL